MLSNFIVNENLKRYLFVEETFCDGRVKSVHVRVPFFVQAYGTLKKVIEIFLVCFET